MPPNAFSIGDVVQLKSGGQAMTVVKLCPVNADFPSGRVTCNWVARKKQVNGSFSPGALVKTGTEARD
jgi:uncharacterized protein YodC (DUF2158 family)